MKRRIPAKIIHLLTALTVLLKGLAKLEHPDGYWPIIMFLFASAAYIATIAVFHDQLHRHERFLTASVYAIEIAVTATVGWVYAHEGKKGLPWMFALAAVMFTAALVVHLVRTRKLS
jgi:hypothetical protein